MADPRCMKWSRKVANLPVSDRAFPEQWSWVLFPLHSRVQDASVLHESLYLKRGREHCGRWRLADCKTEIEIAVSGKQERVTWCDLSRSDYLETF